MLGTRVFRSKEPICSPVDEAFVVVPVLGTRVFKSKEPRGSRVDEALVVGTSGGEKPSALFYLTVPINNPLCSAIVLGKRSELTAVWLTTIYQRNTVYNDAEWNIRRILIGRRAHFFIHPSPN